MKIELGKCYINRTITYLSPILRFYGKDFTNHMAKCHVLAIGLFDTLLEGSDISRERAIYAMFEKDKANNFKSLLDFIKNKPYVLATYCPDSEIIGSKKHMVVFKIPSMFNDTYDNFILGNYKDMYEQKYLDLLFKTSVGREKAYAVMTGNIDMVYSDFVEKIENEFGKIGNISKSSLIDKELDLPPKSREEIFNYTKNETTTEYCRQFLKEDMYN